VALIDANGICHMPAEIPARIACLVPSITELLFALELDDQLVARTQYCIHPADRIKAVPNVGGTKKVKHRLLRRLNPTHVILNIDENTQLLAEQLADYVPHIIVTHPNKPLDNLDLYRLFCGIFHRITEAKQLCRHSRILCTSTKAVLYCTPKSRLICKAERPFAALVYSATAARYTLSGNLWWAKIVPEVTEKVCAHALHRHCWRLARNQCRSTTPQAGQMTSSPLPQRSSRNRPNA